MRSTSQQKMFYKIRIIKQGTSGLIEIKVRTDNHLEWKSLGSTSDVNTDFKIPKTLRRGRWIQVSLSSVTTEKTYLSSITVLWRQKPIK